MAASMMNSKMQSSFLGSSLRTQRPFVPSRVSPVAGTVVAAYGNKLNPGGGKPWERTEVNKNGKPVKVKMHVKAGDIVQVIAGKDKGTVAEIDKVIPTKGLVIVKGVNITTRNIAPRTKDEQGQQKKTESPIHHSNVMHYSTTQSVRSRVGYRFTDDGKKVRYLIKTGEVLEDKSFRRAAKAAAEAEADSSSDSSEPAAGGDAGSA